MDSLKALVFLLALIIFVLCLIIDFIICYIDMGSNGNFMINIAMTIIETMIVVGVIVLL